MEKRIICSAISLLIIHFAAAQSFITVGNAYGVPLIQSDACLESDTCFTLTDDVQSQAGAVWDLDTIDLSASFDATFCLYLGVNDGNGADGFAFVMRGLNSGDLGGVGQGLGYADYPQTVENEGITPSVAIEFDTWDNGAVASDIPDDHTGMFYNGDAGVPIVSVVPLIGEGINAEDGVYHTTRIVWDATSFQMEMYFDDVMLISHQEDIVQTVFAGETEVLWGFTSSTGGSSNLQQICFPTTSIVTEDHFACDGETVTFSFFTDGITTYQWTDDDGNVIVDWDINDGTELTDTLIQTTESGTFFLDFEFNNNTISDSVVVTFIDNPLPPFELDFLEVCPEIDYPIFLDAQNDGGSYLWNNGSEEQLNELGEEGVYSVVVSEPFLGCSVEDSIEVSHYCVPLVVLPNVFSPNSDELNSYFEPIVFNFIGDFEFTVFNRWGGIVYSEDRQIKWDGRDPSATQVNDGVYFYTLSYEGLKGIQKGEISGSFSIFGSGD